MTEQRHPYPPTDPPSAEQPDRVTSAPVPVPPPDRGTSGEADTDSRREAAVDTTADTSADRDTEGLAETQAADFDPDRLRPDDAGPYGTGPDDATADSAEDVTDQVPDETLDDQGTFGDPVLAEERTDPDDLTAVLPGAGEPEVHEPPNQPTAFGAATVAGAAAAAAMAGPSRPVDADRDGAAAGAGDVWSEERSDEEGRPASGAAARDGRVAESRAGGDTVVDEPVTTPDTGLLPGDVPAQTADALWDAGTAQGFRDRWREVQLRFIDDPRDAAEAARGLLNDAVEAFATALTSRKDDLAGWDGDGDTEQLRVAVRRYRDFLDRLLSL